MREYIEERIYETAHYIVENGATVRDAAKVFQISKSTVHKDMTERLPAMDGNLASAVRRVLDVNKAERHIRGGIATYLKFRGANAQPADRPAVQRTRRRRTPARRPLA